MAQELKRPSAPHCINELPFHEPMRMTWKGDPITAMKLGNPDGGPHTMLIIRKDGSITSVVNGGISGVNFLFIDYLLEDEFFSIYGSAKERSDAVDLGPDPTKGPILPNLAIGDSNYRDVPNFTTFWTRNDNRTRRLAMIIHDHPASKNKERQGRDAEGMILCGGYDYEIYGREDGYFERQYRFDGWAPDQLAHFRDREMVTKYLEELKALPGFPAAWA